MYLIQRLEEDTQIQLKLNQVLPQDVAIAHWDSYIRIIIRQTEYDSATPGIWLAIDSPIPLRVEQIHANGPNEKQWIELPLPGACEQECSRYSGQSQILQMDLTQPFEALTFGNSLVAVLSMDRFKKHGSAAFLVDHAPGWHCLREERYQPPKGKPDRLQLLAFAALRESLDEGFPPETGKPTADHGAAKARVEEFKNLRAHAKQVQQRLGLQNDPSICDLLLEADELLAREKVRVGLLRDQSKNLKDAAFKQAALKILDQATIDKIMACT